MSRSLPYATKYVIFLFVTIFTTVQGTESIANTSRTRTIFPSPFLKKYEIIQQRIEGLDFPIRSKNMTLLFRAYEQRFQLRISSCSLTKPEITLLHSEENLEDEKLSNFQYYCSPSSSDSTFVHGWIENGIFYGTIHTEDETYHVDYLDPQNIQEIDGNCVIYRSGDIDLSPLNSYDSSEDKNSIFQRKSKPLAKEFTHGKRAKRATREGVACRVHAYADLAFFLWRGSRNVHSTMGKIYYYFVEANRIFINTDFDGDDEADRIGVVLAKVTVIQDWASMWGVGISPTELDASKVLEEFSRINHDSYCLSVLFMHRDLHAGILGLAWLASSSYYSYPGGICQTRIAYDDGSLSLNTFIVTTQNHGMTVLDPVTALTVTHELGHSFGSSHDPANDPNCSPGGDRGNYLMYPFSSGGTRPNHALFSQCTKNHIAPVIHNKGTCLVEVDLEYCGDGIIQGEEECDCGDPERCHSFDPCCTDPTNFDNACHLLNTSQCSPAVQSCCSFQCGPVALDTEKICHPASACMEVSFCDGVNFDCPDSLPRPDGSLCHGATAICENGICSKSRCTILGLQECFCTGASETHCQLCCFSANEGCTPIHTLGIGSSTGGPIYQLTGSPCLETGFCDRDHLCVQPSKIDTLKRIGNLLHRSTPKRIRKWFRDHLMFTLVAVVIVVLLLASSVILFRINRSLPVESLAYHSARMAVVWQQAQFELLLVSDQIQTLDAKYREVLNATKKMPKDSVACFIRLCRSFPRAPHNLIESILEDSSEGEAIQILVDQGFALSRPKICMSNAEEHIGNLVVRGTKRGDMISTI